MKKLLIATTAVAGLAMFATPAMAQGLSLDLGGFYRGYMLQIDDDAPAGAGLSVGDYDLRHDSEVYFTGEVTLDNGLTVGVHNEIDLGHEGAANSQFNDTTDETYAYFSGNWGRVNVGREDGAQYLLQVAAPSADSNVDGLRQYFNGMNFYGADILAGLGINGWAAAGLGAGALSGSINAKGLDYANDMTRYSNKLTYFTPKFNGFQAGVSYVPQVTDGVKAINQNLGGMASDDDAGDYEDAWELAGRWDGEFEGVGLSFGAGYGKADTEVNTAAGGVGSDDRTQWNISAAATWNQFSAGVVYKEDNHGISATAAGHLDEENTWVFGLAWDQGPWHVGASFLNADYERRAATDIEIDRYTFGAGYEFGPGMSFRGAVAFGSYDNSLGAAGANNDKDFTQVTLGTEVNF